MGVWLGLHLGSHLRICLLLLGCGPCQPHLSNLNRFRLELSGHPPPTPHHAHQGTGLPLVSKTIILSTQHE